MSPISFGARKAPFETLADGAYGLICARLERAGQTIGANDLLIAAHAVSVGCVIVTDDESEFERVEGLSHENWLRQL